MSEPISPAPRPGRPPGSTARGCLGSLGAIGAVLIVILLLNQGEDDDGNNAAPTPATSQSTYTTEPPPITTPTPATTPTSAATPTSEAPTPFKSGTCLNGTLPDSTTAQEVNDVEEVSCSASDAHYEVIETIPMTSEMSRCNDNPKTQYAFSYRYTLNGSTINEYVYCLIGLGSYAR
ncbi:LppU/SCO3897 family protein [Streptomyces sp. NPDC054871]